MTWRKKLPALAPDEVAANVVYWANVRAGAAAAADGPARAAAKQLAAQRALADKLLQHLLQQMQFHALLLKLLAHT